MSTLAITPEIEQALADNAALVLSISGGKDSDAMCYTVLADLRERGWLTPNAQRSVYLVHADLGRAEWSHTPAYVERQAARLGLPLAVVRHSKGDLIDGIRRRMTKRPDAPPFPSSAARWCTSDYKRSIVSRWIRRTFPQNRTVICAMGLRAEESPARARREVVRLRKDACAPTKGRTVYDWLPIHDFTTADVWHTIGYTLDELAAIQATCRELQSAGDEPIRYLEQIEFKAHFAYGLGNTRLSCALCIMASANDLLNGALHNPDTYRELVDLEIESGYAFRHGQWLADLRPELLTDHQRERLTIVRATRAAAAPPHKVPVRPQQLRLF